MDAWFSQVPTPQLAQVILMFHTQKIRIFASNLVFRKTILKIFNISQVITSNILYEKFNQKPRFTTRISF